ncbi:MAG: hypothetical protein OES14_04260 [Nitrosopumilus sp.]|nr:hypothetical protein [Nitrosopumilus sp.]MDH3824985.1 hypothetical protein [Nitrosopumilus sp.]
MKHMIQVDISNSSGVVLELNDENSPKTVKLFLEKLPFSLELNVWGDEIYTSSSPIDIPEENSKSPVSLHDVAFWPTGRAICLFYGPTPIGKNGEITPASPVNIIGKIIDPNKSVLDNAEGKEATFRLKS